MDERLINSQKGEMDAVILYQKLAKLVKDEDEKKLLLKNAADEGKHAAILKKYTGVNVKGSRKKAILVSLVYKLAGREKAFMLVADGEYKTLYPYGAMVGEYPEIKAIMDDEIHHGNVMKELAKK